MGFQFVANTISPGEGISQQKIVDLITPDKIPDVIYYYLSFEVETDPAIIKSLKELKLNRDEIEANTIKDCSAWGSIQKIK